RARRPRRRHRFLRLPARGPEEADRRRDGRGEPRDDRGAQGGSGGRGQRGVRRARSLETSVALKPDLVVATSAGNGDEVFTQLGRLKMAVYVVNPTRLNDVFDLIARLSAPARHEAE